MHMKKLKYIAICPDNNETNKLLYILYDASKDTITRIEEYLYFVNARGILSVSEYEFKKMDNYVFKEYIDRAKTPEAVITFLKLVKTPLIVQLQFADDTNVLFIQEIKI